MAFKLQLFDLLSCQRSIVRGKPKEKEPAQVTEREFWDVSGIWKAWGKRLKPNLDRMGQGVCLSEAGEEQLSIRKE